MTQNTLGDAGKAALKRHRKHIAKQDRDAEFARTDKERAELMAWARKHHESLGGDQPYARAVEFVLTHLMMAVDEQQRILNAMMGGEPLPTAKTLEKKAMPELPPRKLATPPALPLIKDEDRIAARADSAAMVQHCIESVRNTEPETDRHVIVKAYELRGHLLFTLKLCEELKLLRHELQHHVAKAAPSNGSHKHSGRRHRR